MKSQQKAAVATLAALALTLSACSGGGGSQPSGSTSAKSSNKTATASYNPQPVENLKDGGTLTTAIGEITDQGNVWHEQMTTDTRLLWNWYNPVLFTYTPEGEFQVDKNYVVDMPKEEVKDGKTVVTYKLNPKAVFNDGTPIDWTAFEAAWKACGEVTKDAFSCNSTDGYNKIESIKAGADSHEVVVSFKAAYPWWKALFLNVLHPKAAEAKAFAEGYTGGERHPEWGAGPFKIEKISANEGVATFVRNEKWWGDAPKLEKRTYLVRETSAMIQAFKNGELDAAGVTNKDLLAQVRDMSGIDIRKGNVTGVNLLTLNSASPVLGDIKVREAIVRGIDRSTLAKVSFQGLDYAEEPPGSFLLYAFQKGYEDNFGAQGAFDPAKSAQLLDEAGWKAAGEGQPRTKDGKALEIVLPYFGDAQLTKDRVQVIVGALAKVGIKVTAEPHPSSEFSSVMKAKKWDIMISGFSANDPFGAGGLCQMYCTNEASGSTLNKSGTQTKELDAKIREQEKLTSADEQIAAMNKIEKEALATYGLMPLWSGPQMVATKQGLANYGASVFHTPFVWSVGWQK